jgi:type II secretory pathway pseudopilin PulG
MFKKRNRQSGIMLMEIILAIALLAIFLAGIAALIKRQETILKNKTTASYMNEILEATSAYMNDNYDTILEDIGGSSINNVLIIDVSSRLITNGYLPTGFKIDKPPYGKEAKVSILLKEEGLEAFVVLPSASNLSTANSVNIASFIPEGKGGVYFTAQAPATPCISTTKCIQGILGLWTYQIDSIAGGVGGVGAVVGDNGLFESAFSSEIPADTEKKSIPVAHTKLETGSGPYLARHLAWNNLGANTINADLNLSSNDPADTTKNVKIFFNATDTDANGDFKEGSYLSYEQSEITGTGLFNHTLLLTDNVGVDTDSDGLGDGKDYGHGSAIDMDRPVLSADGGLAPGLIKKVSGLYPACTATGILGINEEDEFIQCLSGVWTPFPRDAIVKSTTIKTSASAALIKLENPGGSVFYYLVALNANGGYVLDASFDPLNDIVSVIGYIE